MSVYSGSLPAEKPTVPLLEVCAYYSIAVTIVAALLSPLPVILSVVALYYVFRLLTKEAESRAGPWGPHWLREAIGIFLTRLYAGEMRQVVDPVTGWWTRFLCCVPVKRVVPPKAAIDPERQHGARGFFFGPSSLPLVADCFRLLSSQSSCGTRTDRTPRLQRCTAGTSR